MLIQILIIQIITFIGLIFVLRILFYRQLSSALTRLKHLHDENLMREEELNKKLKEVGELREAELLKVKQEAEEIVKEAKQTAAKMSANSQEFAKKEAQRIIGHATSDLRKREEDLQNKYQEQALDFSVELLKLTFSQQGKIALQHELLTELIDELSNLPQEKFTVKTSNVKIISAAALNASEKERLIKILNKKTGQEVTFEECVDPEILAGLIIHIGALIIDGSLKNKLRKAIPHIKKVGK
jgi:F-type H+-transporting ATPase subunit b